MATVNAWWEARDEGTMPDGVLPPDGVLIFDGGKAVAAAWLYLPVDCKAAMLDWLVTRPGMEPARARRACRLALRYLVGVAERSGRKHVFASVCRHGMEREAMACGFHVISTANTHLVFNL